MANDFFNDVLPMDQSGMDFLKSGNVPDAGSNDWGFSMGGQGDNSFDFLNSPKYNTGDATNLNNLFGPQGAVTSAGGLLSSLFGMGAARQNRAAMQNLADQQAFYNNKLQQSYNDPNSYLNSPEGRALRAANAQAIARKAAATGRRSQTGAQMNALDQVMMDNLDKYRQGLARSYNPQIAMAAQSAAQRKSPLGEGLMGLANLFGSQGGQQLLGKALPVLGGALGGLGGLAGNALGGLSGLFGGSSAAPDLSFADLGKGFTDLPSIDEFL